MTATISFSQRLKNLVRRKEETTAENVEQLAVELMSGKSIDDDALQATLNRIGATGDQLDAEIERRRARVSQHTDLKTVVEAKSQAERLEAEQDRLNREEHARRAEWDEKNITRAKRISQLRGTTLRESSLRDSLLRTAPKRLRDQIDAKNSERMEVARKIMALSHDVEEAQIFVDTGNRVLNKGRAANSQATVAALAFPEDIKGTGHEQTIIQAQRSQSNLRTWEPQLAELRRRQSQLDAELERLTEEAIAAA